jgi:hypothetical protein
VAAEHPLLGRLADAGRLLWYDLSTSPVRHGSGPTVEATYFSAEAALNLLALAGARTIRSLGVDGGSDYSSDFSDLNGKTLLANGHTDFDLQFQGFARTILRSKIDFAPLDLPSPARVYVAHAAAEVLPVAVLAHSIRRRASLSVTVVPLAVGAAGSDPDGPGGVVLPPRAVCLSDVRRLWTIPLADAREQLRLITFAADGREPWLSVAHPRGHLWMTELLDAIAAGALPLELVQQEVGRGHVRPSILYQLDHGLVEPLLVPRSVRRQDRTFHAAQGSWAGRQVGALHALVRQLGRRVDQYRAERGARVHAARRAIGAGDGARAAG